MKTPVWVVSVDLSKAFDKIQYGARFSALEAQDVKKQRDEDGQDKHEQVQEEDKDEQAKEEEKDEEQSKEEEKDEEQTKEEGKDDEAVASQSD